APRLSNRYREPAPVPTIVSIGAAGRRKNISSLLEAFRLIRRDLPDAELHLVGPGLDERGEIARRQPSGSSAHFHGPLSREEIGALFARSWLMIHPSLEETFGMSIAEAMAAGVPVVGGAASGAVPWVLDGGRVGVLADVTDPTDIARA